MAADSEVGMQTFDSVLYELFSTGRISEDEALRHADSKTNLKLKMRLRGAGGGS